MLGLHYSIARVGVAGLTVVMTAKDTVQPSTLIRDKAAAAVPGEARVTRIRHNFVFGYREFRRVVSRVVDESGKPVVAERPPLGRKVS